MSNLPPINFEPVDFSPTMQKYSGQGAFRFWCQTVLPLIYDDSLSYYELLNKIVVYLNKTIEDVGKAEDNINSLNTSFGLLQNEYNLKTFETVNRVNLLLTQFTELKNYVDNYFENLDTQAEIEAVLDKWVSSGEFSDLLYPVVQPMVPPIVAPEVTKWLNEYFENHDTKPEIEAVLDNWVSSGEFSDLLYPVVQPMVPPIAAPEVTKWLNENVDPVGSAVVVDTTLTVSGAAADAKATGDTINIVKNELTAFEDADGVVHYGNDGEMSSTASFPYAKRIGNLLMLDGQYGKDSSKTYCIKLTGNLNKGSSIATAEGWSKELTLDSGKTYNVRMDLMSGTLNTTANNLFEIRVLDSSNNVIQSVGLGESKNFTWTSGTALLYLAAEHDISCTNVVLSIFVIDVTSFNALLIKDINYTLDYLSADVFSRYGTDYAPNKAYSGTSDNIINSSSQFITGYIPVSAGDCLKSFVNGINWTKERVDGQVRKIAFYDSSKTWLKTISSSNGFGGEYYTVETSGYIRMMLRNTDVNPQIFLTSILKKDRLVDLIVFAGQSNMAGRGETNSTFPESYPTIIPGAGYEFKSITDPTKLYPLEEPFGYAENAPDDANGIDDGTKKTGDLVAAFVNAYYKNNGNVPTVCVSASEGGSSSDEWLPTTGNNFVDLSSRLNSARHWLVDNGYAIRHQYCVWCQGESDGDNIAGGTETFAEYETRARSIFNGLISLGLEKVLLVRVGNHNSGSSKRYTAIIRWQTKEAQTNDNLVMVSCDFAGMRSKGMMKDSFHYFQIGYNIAGYNAGINAALYATTGKEPTMYDPENNDLYYSHKN